MPNGLLIMQNLTTLLHVLFIIRASFSHVELQFRINTRLITIILTS